MLFRVPKEPSLHCLISADVYTAFSLRILRPGTGRSSYRAIGPAQAGVTPSCYCESLLFATLLFALNHHRLTPVWYLNQSST